MRFVQRVLGFVAATLLVAGCSATQETPTAVQADRAEGGRSAAARVPSRPMSIEDEFVAIAESEPGFAGLYLDEDLIPVLVSRGPQLSESAKSRVLARVAARSGAFSSITQSRVQSARYSWLELEAIRSQVRDVVNASGIPLGVGIDVKKNALVLTAQTTTLDNARSALAKAGVPIDAFELRVMDNIVSGASLRSVVRPVTGGLMINSIASATTGYCSVGLQAWKNDVNGYPDPTLGRFVLTANHCAPPAGTVTGLTFGQPHRGYGLHMTEVVNAEVFSDARCPYAASLPCQYADVAVLQMADSVSSTWQRVALSNTANPPAYLGQLSLNTSVWSAVQGQPVRRVGARSGQRNGTVTNACYDLNVPGFWYILCSVEVNGHANGGDSGGPVYTPLTAGYTGSPWPSGIFHSYNANGNSPFWFSSVGSVLFALNGAFTI